MKVLLFAIVCLGTAAELVAAQSFMEKPSGAVRVMSWNIGDESIFPETSGPDTAGVGRPAQFRRVIRALQPDVLCLQDITREVREIAALLEDIFPLAGGRGWQSHQVLDNAIVSRFPLGQRGQEILAGALQPRGHAIALVDLPSGFAGDLYMLCAHFDPRSGADRVRNRELHARALARQIQDTSATDGTAALPPRTTYVVLGDLNVIDDPASYMDILLKAGLTDLLPRQNGIGPDFYTWRDDEQPYPAGALDRILFRGSSVHVGNAFVLNTTTMSYDELRRHGLKLVDVLLFADRGVHDHLPLVADFLPVRR
jgi:endonuclease/exonuclease/phosphatase family metal-dependent hydrolase